MLLTLFSCKAQEKVTLLYLGYQYNNTKNSSFVSKELNFLKANDTLHMNIRLPYDTIKHEIINRGIYYNCHLKKDTTYTFTLKKICVNNIPDVPNSYYKTNTIPNKKDCSKFTEVEKNTGYKYEGNYGKYVDIDRTLYEIIGLSPNDGCFFPH